MARSVKGNLVDADPGIAPGSRPKHARQDLARGFITDIHKLWAERGLEVLERVIEVKPEAFLAVVGKLMPKEIEISKTPEQEMSDAQLAAAIDELRGNLGIPNAGAAGRADSGGSTPVKGSVH